jgi:hypothetical protein
VRGGRLPDRQPLEPRPQVGAQAVRSVVNVRGLLDGRQRLPDRPLRLLLGPEAAPLRLPPLDLPRLGVEGRRRVVDDPPAAAAFRLGTARRGPSR